MCSGILVVDAFSQTITLSPDPLTLVTNTTGNMTATLSVAAPVGGTSLELQATGGVTVPSPVTVPAGETTITFPVTAGAVGESQIIASATGFLGDLATVLVVEPSVEISCDEASRNVAHAARAYTKAVNSVDRLCRNGGTGECITALSQTTAAINALNQAHEVMLEACQ